MLSNLRATTYFDGRRFCWVHTYDFLLNGVHRYIAVGWTRDSDPYAALFQMTKTLLRELE